MRKTLIAIIIGPLVMSVSLLAVLYGVSGLPPVQPLEHVDTAGNKDNILSKSEPAQAVFGSVVLARTATPKLIVLGPSVMRDGFVRADWVATAPGYEFHNFGVGAMTPEETFRLFRHIEAEVPPQVAKRSVVILGASYPVFSDVFENYIEKEEKGLLPFYLLSGFDWSGRLVTYAKKMSPALFFVRAQLSDVIDRGIKAMMLTRSPKPAAPQPAATLTEQQKREAVMDTWNRHVMGGTNMISERQFRYFIDLIEHMHAAGFNVVVVDMPLPKWHRDASLYDQIFQKRLKEMMMTRFASVAGIEYVDIHGDVGEEEFEDSAHVNRTGAKTIVRLLTSQVSLFTEHDGVLSWE